MPRAKTAKNGNSKSKHVESAAPVLNEVNVSLSSGDIQTEIRRRAFELYLERGAVPGHEHEDWLSAEREILSRSHQSV